MKIFLSHASRDKPLVREVIFYFPKSLTMWLDEKDLPIGSDISHSLQSAITHKSDLILYFVSPESISSEWTKKELKWALERESEIGSIFIFPIVLDKGSWTKIIPEDFQDRRYLELQDFSTESVESLSDKLQKEIFDWMARKINSLPEIPLKLSVAKLSLELSALHLANIRDLTGNMSAPNKIMGFMLKENTSKIKNKQNLGIPCLNLKIVNKGDDIEIINISVIFNDNISGNNQNIFDDAQAISITSLEYENKKPIGKVLLKTNHSEEFSIKDEIVIEQILKRGLKSIKIEDAINNSFYVSREEIDEANSYIEQYFKLDGISDLYETYHSS